MFKIVGGGLRMAKYMLVVGMNVPDPSKEKEFNDWYNKIHIPDVLEIPEFKKASRLEHVSPGEKDTKFMALYEIETSDIKATMKALDSKVAEKRKAGRMSELGKPVMVGFYKQTYSK
jgi:hypothetical protein